MQRFCGVVMLGLLVAGCAGGSRAPAAPGPSAAVASGTSGASSTASTATSTGTTGTITSTATGASTGTAGTTTSTGTTGTGASTGMTGTGTSTGTTGTGASGTSGASGTGSTGGLNPAVAPGGNFDLSLWELQLPVCSSGSVTVIPPAQLVGSGGFQDTYFYSDPSDGAMVLMDPTTGCTTSGSLHPRTELREMSASGAKASWPATGTHVLSVTERVPQVPDHVSVGQIFQAPPYPSKPLLELEYHHDGTLVLLLENTNQGGSATFTTVGAVPPGSTYQYALSLSGTSITVTINGTSSTFTLPPTFVGESFYFKAGDYDQTATAGTPGTTPGTLVEITALSVTHT